MARTALIKYEINNHVIVLGCRKHQVVVCDFHDQLFFQIPFQHVTCTGQPICRTIITPGLGQRQEKYSLKREKFFNSYLNRITENQQAFQKILNLILIQADDTEHSFYQYMIHCLYLSKTRTQYFLHNHILCNLHKEEIHGCC